MHIRPNTLAVDDYTPTAPAAGSAEPMRKADHKSKRHPKPRPARKSETLGGGHFVFRRHADGRIHPRQDPFEHGTLISANEEAGRLTETHGGTFEVYSRAGVAAVRVDWSDQIDDYATEGSGELYGDGPHEGGAA